MREFRQHLDKASFDALNVLLGSKIQSLFSPDCDVDAGSALITVPSVSIPIGLERFVVLDNDWADTPEEWINYFFLSARIANTPKDIFYNPNPGPGGTNYKSDHLSLHLGPTASVETIDVLCAAETGSEESVSYDAGLLIARRDGLRVAIVRQQSIAAFLQFAHTEQDIAQVTAGLDVRCTVAGHNNSFKPRPLRGPA
ncbi:hypothetical protein [Lysobacter sp. M2-1]|uniref:hypothetical protein n=1 Tax=Lysobacter sp. M2-1 TaxID=2916839 RepID=UPI001F59BCDC|nr:hypothetical protein [Lysobacter sp. M2-1]